MAYSGEADGTALSLAGLAALFDRMADGVYAVDSGQHVVYWNPAAERITGVTGEEAVGRQCYDVMAGTDIAGRCYCRVDCDTIVCARRGEGVESYDVLARPGERRLWVNMSILPVRTAGFDQPLAVHIFRDITRPRMAEVLAEEAVAVVARYAEAIQTAQPGEPVADHLTPRELEVLRLLAAGATVRAIALELVITPATVRAHIEHLMNKLGAHTRLQAVVVAARRDLL
ncbi:MAG: PAS and helix-turn-helix domain-containing protein [Thermoflexaceae bacterium]|nr:PAS and helix-turn-helix domain-containing protein [Thermoflexaceae bacterium]